MKSIHLMSPLYLVDGRKHTHTYSLFLSSYASHRKFTYTSRLKRKYTYRRAQHTDITDMRFQIEQS